MDTNPTKPTGSSISADPPPSQDPHNNEEIGTIDPNRNNSNGNSVTQKEIIEIEIQTPGTGETSTQNEQQHQKQDPVQEIRKEIIALALEMAKISDKSKNPLLKEEEKQELLYYVKQMEEKKEALTKKLPEYDPIAAGKFRTSTPTPAEEMVIDIGTPTRKRTLSILKKSFSDTDLSSYPKSQKPKTTENQQKKIESFFTPSTQGSKTNTPNDTEDEDDTGHRAKTKNRGRGRGNTHNQAGRGNPKSRTPTPIKKPSIPKKEQNNQTSISNSTTTKPQEQNEEKNKSIDPSTLFTPLKTGPTNKETENSQTKPSKDTEDKLEKTWEKYIKQHPTPDATALRRHFQKIYSFFEELFTKQHPQTTKIEDKPLNQINKDIQELKKHHSESQKKQQETMNELKEIKKMLEKSNQTFQQSIKQIDKSVQQNVKHKEYPALQSYADRLKKNLQCNQIANKNDNIFDFNVNLKGVKIEKEKEESTINYIMEKSKIFRNNSNIDLIRLINGGTTIKIRGTSTEKENLKQNLQKIINEVTQEEVDITSRKSSEVMKITAINASFSDEQIHGMIEENLNVPQYNRNYIRENVKIFRRITSRFDSTKMTVFMRVTSPLLESINSKKEFLPSPNHFRRVTITPIIYVSNCTKCFGFHASAKCEEMNLCKNCGSSEHKISECKATKNCINCKRANRGKGTLNHLPTDKECPQLQRELERQTERCYREANPSIIEELKSQNNNALLTQINNLQHG
nr:PREDICTED: uncharacterized protein LOC109041633 [Bemisia tabaci]XP_018913570.1 PREDICTED: uncharacterized protein LOC109041633 [Bemisia tabaci]